MGIESLLGDERLTRVRDDLERLKRRSIRIHAARVEEAGLGFGDSKLGGLPDLPSGVEWPMTRLNVPPPSPGFLRAHPDFPVLPPDGRIPLPFIAQLRMSDLAPYDRDGLLPRSGILYLFYNTVAYLSDKGGRTGVHDQITGYSYREYDFGTPANWRVFHYDGSLSRLYRAARPEGMHEEVRYQSCVLTFSGEWTLPQVETYFIGDWGSTEGKLVLTEEEWDAYADLRHEERGTGCIHQMLGHSDDVQPYAMEGGYRSVRGVFFPDLPSWEALSAQERQAELEQGRLLLQVDAQDNGMRFGRDGRLYFFIREAELSARDFSKVWAREQ